MYIIQTLKFRKIYFTFSHLMTGFTEKVEVPFNYVNSLVTHRHLYFHFENNERQEVNCTYYFVSGILSQINSSDSEAAQEIADNKVELKDNKLAGKFVSKNVISLSQRQLKKSETSLLSKGLKLVFQPKRTAKAKAKHTLKVFRRKLILMWCFRKDE